VRARYVVLTGTAERQAEARAAAGSFLPEADLAVDLFALPDGRLPAAWGEVKEVLEQVASTCAPDLVLAPSAQDAHQDHRTIGEIGTGDAICYSIEDQRGPPTNNELVTVGVILSLAISLPRGKLTQLITDIGTDLADVV